MAKFFNLFCERKFNHINLPKFFALLVVRKLGKSRISITNFKGSVLCYKGLIEFQLLLFCSKEGSIILLSRSKCTSIIKHAVNKMYILQAKCPFLDKWRCMQKGEVLHSSNKRAFNDDKIISKKAHCQVCRSWESTT